MEFEPVIAKTGFVSIKKGGIRRNGIDRLMLYPSALKTKVLFPFSIFIKGLDIPLYSIKDIEESHTVWDNSITITYDDMGKEKHVKIFFGRMGGSAKNVKEFHAALEQAMPKKRVSSIRAEKQT